jgi:hypothetical protein
MARNFFASRGIRQYQNAISQAQAQAQANGISLTYQEAQGQVGSVGANSGRIASLLNQAAANSGQIYEARAQARRLYDFSQGHTAVGAELGFRRDQGGMSGDITIPGTNIGFRNPLSLLPGLGSDAAQAGWYIWAQQQALRASPGINGDQARAIAENLTGLGWSGEDFHNLAFNAVAPLVRQGQDPNVITPIIDQALRNGQNSIRDIVDTFNDLGTAAQAARLPLSEMTQGVESFSQAAEAAGGTRLGGIQSGIEFTRATGMAPQIGSALMQNPIVQATAMRTLGILPQEMGSLTGGELSNVSTQALEMAMQLSAPLNRPTVEHTPGGNITIPGFTHQIARAAQMLGITTDQARRMWQQRSQAPARAQAEDMLTQFGAEARQARAAEQRAHNRHIQDNVPPVPGAFKQNGKWYINSTVAGGQGQPIELNTSGTVENAFRTQLETGGSPHDNFINWDEASRQLLKAGLTQNQVTQLSHINDPVSRARSAEGMLSQLSKARVPDASSQQVRVAFTGLAEKFFRQVGMDQSKLNANAGGTPINQNYTQALVRGMSWQDQLKFIETQTGGG